MPQPTKGPRLGGSPAHQKMMLANLATSLFTHGKIHTTRAKAERLRPYAERLITKAKQGDLHNRRLIGQQIRDKDVVHRLMAEIGPFFADRAGGYTRITKTLPRKGDNAPMAVIELVSERTASAEASQATRTASRRGSTPEVGGTATGAAATAATIADAESDASPENTEIGAVTDDTAAGASAEEAVGTESESPEVPEATEASEASGASEASEAEVPEPMAEAAAENAGLDTDADASPEDRS